MYNKEYHAAYYQKHKQKHNEQTRDWMRKRRADPEFRKLDYERSEEIRARRTAGSREYIEQYKLSHPCSCGETRPWCLDFDHRDPKTKKFRIADGMQHRSFEAVKKEIEKCDVRCANCHRDKHYHEKLAA